MISDEETNRDDYCERLSKLWWSDGLPCVQVLRWSASICRVFEVSYTSFVVRSNAMHQIFYWSDLSIQRQFCKIIWSSKSLAQVWICSIECCNVEISKLKKIKVWQSRSNSRLKWLKCVWYLILSIGMSYYQEGCNISCLTWSKVLIGHPKWESWEKTPEN